MTFGQRLTRLVMPALLACLMALAGVTPVLADADEGEGFEANDLILPLVIGIVVVAGAVALWRRRAQGPHPR
jgi:hypothetical protein